MADGVLWWPWAVLAIVALVVLAFGVRDLPDNLAANRGEGVTGTFVAAEDLGCGRSLATGCSWRGSFESDNGIVSVDEVFLFDGGPGAVGETAHVRYIDSGESGMVYELDGDTTWAWTIALMVASSSYLSGYAVALVERIRRAR